MCFYLTIFPWVHIGYEMVDNLNEARSAKLAIIISYLNITVSGFKHAHKISLRILPDFICKKKSDFQLFLNKLFWADVYSYHIWRTWYNGSYTMMAKPVRALELHYPMFQFLIVNDMRYLFMCCCEAYGFQAVKIVSGHSF